jgi:hypothetical protein
VSPAPERDVIVPARNALPVAAPRPAKPCGCGGGCGGNCGCGVEDACGLERVRFFPRQLLGADDLNAEQHYFREKLRRHNRFLHGWGVVCGCEVKAAPTREKPLQVVICPGYVVTPQGDEILIGAPAYFDLATCMVSSDDPCAFSRPCPPVTTTLPQRQVLHLAVCYKECEVRPVRVAPVGCSCDDVACDYSRIRDAYEFRCLDTLPGCGQKPDYDCRELCAGGIFPCPHCSCDPCVVLATIRLRGEGREENALVAEGLAAYGGVAIDNSTNRKLLYSTEMIQALAWCICRGDRRQVIGEVAEPVDRAPNDG